MTANVASVKWNASLDVQGPPTKFRQNERFV